MTRIIGAGGSRGKGGGGGQQRAPVEADDSLQSIHSLPTVLDLLSEGEIQGLDDGLKSVFLDRHPCR
jgi:predicted phage tail protein